MEKPRILSTKVLSSEMLDRFYSAGLELETHDFIEIEKTHGNVGAECFTSKQFLITSQNTVQTLIDLVSIHNLQNKNILCVGTKTERLLLSKGIFVSDMYKNSNELAQDAVRLEVGTTFFTGKRRMPVIERVFEEKGVELNVVELYDTVLTPVKKGEGYSAVLFFSPSGVESFFKENKLRGAKAVCIGTTTEKAVREFTDNTRIAEVTTVESVVDATLELMMSYAK
jgi:uroporphyrinogen-III synthase